jgi:hypothetical protein
VAVRRRRWIRPIVAVLAVLALYPAFVLGYTWAHVLRSDLPGGRHGPLDAYRHTLASAVVAWSAGPRAVQWVTDAMERDARLPSRMDRHNNRVGAAIGTSAARFADIEPTVRASVRRGAVNASGPQQTTWLPPEYWRARRFW